MLPPRTGRPCFAPRRVLCFVFLFLFFSCPFVSAATRVITDADKGTTVAMNVGDVLEVRLGANPTTGYMWYLHRQSTPLLKLTGQSQTGPTGPGVGRPVYQVFTFKARSGGEGVLLLHYVRSWEPPSPGEQQFDLHVSIQ